MLLCSLIPETKGRSLEEMDVIFGSVQADKRQADIAAQERGTFAVSSKLGCTGSPPSLPSSRKGRRWVGRQGLMPDARPSRYDDLTARFLDVLYSGLDSYLPRGLYQQRFGPP